MERNEEGHLTVAVARRHLCDQPEGAIRIDLRAQDRVESLKRASRVGTVSQDVARILAEQPGARLFEIKAERVNDFETATAVLLVERLRGDERLGFPNRVDPQVVPGDDRRSWGILGSRFFDGRVDPYGLG
jgi:hypothetical protein